MRDLEVGALSIEELIYKLRNRGWQVPQFQREFVWSTGDVIELVHSILCARPIGMATIWEQPDEGGLPLEPLSLSDKAQSAKHSIKVSFCDTDRDPNKVYAVLDGRQRCTAIAMAFGGLRSTHGDLKTTGRFYLNVSALDPLEQIVFMRERDVLAKGFNSDAACIAQGYFPLASTHTNETLMSQWFRYIQEIHNPVYYIDSRLPDDAEMARRDDILRRAFEGLAKTKLAVYIVPDTYSLFDICDIFEKLNTTGTKVSTVDLIHSWLYSETERDEGKTIRLREWIADLGQVDGAIGWADAIERPELTVQIATAIYIARSQKPKARTVGRSSAPIASVKAGDLLATPTEHWRYVIEHDVDIAEFLGDFQSAVAGGFFPWRACPYPVTSAIYVALRFHLRYDPELDHPWEVADLDALFHAFFWQNSLSTRYDQGFLTQLGVDIRELKKLLSLRSKYTQRRDWVDAVKPELRKLVGKPLPSKDDLIEWLTSGRQTGAIQKALLLPMVARAQRDLLDSSILLRFPEAGSPAELHHIYPRDWCRNNQVGSLSNLLDPDKADKDWVSSAVNLMPLSRQSNNEWKAKIPQQVLQEHKIDYATCADVLGSAFIDEFGFQALMQGAEGLGQFWSHRADVMSDFFLREMELRYL